MAALTASSITSFGRMAGPAEKLYFILKLNLLRHKDKTYCLSLESFDGLFHLINFALYLRTNNLELCHSISKSKEMNMTFVS